MLPSCYWCRAGCGYFRCCLLVRRCATRYRNTSARWSASEQTCLEDAIFTIPFIPFGLQLDSDSLVVASLWRCQRADRCQSRVGCAKRQPRCQRTGHSSVGERDHRGRCRGKSRVAASRCGRAIVQRGHRQDGPLRRRHLLDRKVAGRRSAMHQRVFWQRSHLRHRQGLRNPGRCGSGTATSSPRAAITHATTPRTRPGGMAASGR